jgi:hypothetical protein
MTTKILCPDKAADAAILRVERRLARYHANVRPRVQALARRHPRLADLAASFPALLFALAAPRKGFQPESVIQHAIEGAPLKMLASLAAVPFWLRKLPPEAFTRPLPALPDDDLFRRQAPNFLPRSFRTASRWMEAVAEAVEWGNEPISRWIAREAGPWGGEAIPLMELRLICLWAWYCGQPGTNAHARCAAVWQSTMRFETARDAAAKWLSRVELYLHLGEAPVEDMWLEAGNLAGYAFVPLRSAADIEAEARAMDNCAASFGDAVASGRARLWSMRRDGGRVATIEIGARYGEPLLHIRQMRRAKNSACSNDEWWAARQWLNQHDLAHLVLRQATGRNVTAFSRSSWGSFWRPYWLAKRRIPHWLPLAPSTQALAALSERAYRR